MEKRIRCQKRLPGISRIWKGGGVLPQVEKMVLQDARHFRVSASFVLATIVTQHYERVNRTHFLEQERYDVPVESRRRKAS